MSPPKRRISYAQRTVRAWAAILLSFFTMLIGIAGAPLAIIHFYYEPLCQHYAEEQGAGYWSYESSSRHHPKRCNADGNSATIVELGGLTAVALTLVHELFPPFGMVLGLIGGLLLWQRISGWLDWLSIARSRIKQSATRQIKTSQRKPVCPGEVETQVRKPDDKDRPEKAGFPRQK